jgi:hypothetical protein
LKINLEDNPELKDKKDNLDSNYSFFYKNFSRVTRKVFQGTINLLIDRLGYYFYLLPSIYYLKYSDEIFQFNHAVGAFLINIKSKSFLDDDIYKFVKFEDRDLLWSDIEFDQPLPRCIRNKKRGDVGMLCPLSKIYEKMRFNNIVAKFGGHQHEVPLLKGFDEENVLREIKELYGMHSLNRVISAYENLPFFNGLKKSLDIFFKLLKPSYKMDFSDEELSMRDFGELLDNLASENLNIILKKYYFLEMVGDNKKIFGACSFADESLSNYIFILISGVIGLPPASYNYYPSYLELNIARDSWSVAGYYLERDGQRKKIIMK